jgi:hypothetical protein
MAGYSGTPLVKKLGLKPGDRIQLLGEPPQTRALLAPLPDGVAFVEGDARELDVIHVFSTSKEELGKALPGLAGRIKPNGMIWVSWPKKSSGVPSTLTEDVIRAIALPLGLVDVKVCAVDDIWSGLRLVIRKEKRGK